jgi:rhomboid protease GluP
VDLDFVITFVVLASAAAGARTAIRSRAWRWLGIQGANLVVLGLAWLFLRGHVIAVVGPVWGLSILAPGLATTLSDRYSRAERFGTALVFARIAATLHPNATTKLRVRVAEVQRFEVQGRLDEARRALDALIEKDFGRALATLIRFRLDQDWAGVRAHLEQARPMLEADPAAISFYLRALGELGEREELLALYARTPHSRVLAAVEGQLMLFAAAFGGLEEATALVLRARHAEMPEDGKRLWVLTAAKAAGKDVTAELHDLCKTARPRVALVAKTRIAQPPPPPLSDAAKAVLADLDRSAGTLEPARAARPSASGAIALVNLYAFVREIPGGTTSAVNLHKLGALYTGDIEPSELYRLFTATILHYGALHVSMNVLGLLVLGPPLEAAIGRTRFVVIYLVSGIAANALAVAWTKYGGGEAALLVGASGAVMGVAGALLVRRALRWMQRRTPLARREVMSLVAMFALQIVFDAVTPHVAGAVHIFGALVGGLLVLLIARPRRTPAAPRLDGTRRARVATAIGVLASVGVLEIAWRASAQDYSPSGECADGDIGSCEEDCVAQLGPEVVDGGAPARSPRFGGDRGKYMLRSCGRLAYALSNGPDAGPEGKRRAYAIYAATCEAGNMLGCTNEGVMLGRGEGVAPDEDAAIQRYAHACDGGEPRGCVYYADELRHEGKLEEARRFFLRACDAGDEKGCAETVP